MKLFIIFSILFVQLAFASIFPPLARKPTYIAIFDKGHLITTNEKSVQELDVEQVGDVLLFRFHHNAVYYQMRYEFVAIKADENGWSNHTFVIEQSEIIPPGSRNEEAYETYCLWEHKEPERKLIDDCYGALRIRFQLNEDEQAKIQESKKALSEIGSESNQGEEKLKYKVTFNERKFTTESVDLKQLKVVNQRGSIEVKALLDDQKTGFIGLEDKTFGKSAFDYAKFVVESVQTAPKKCHDQKHFFDLVYCTGKIQVRKMTESEKAKY